MTEMNSKTKEPFKIDGEQLWLAMLAEWRIWLLGALAGALIAFAIYSINPPDFRARATVVVDQNVEEAWTYYPDRQLFQFVRRETVRLVELAWSDAVLSQLGSEEFSFSQLRNHVLQLSQPSDGGWHFYAKMTDAQAAADLANSWTAAFVASITSAIEANPEMQAARQALDTLVLSNPEPNDAELIALTNQITELAETTKGISPYVEVSLSQAASAENSRNPSMATYLLFGALIGLVAGGIYSSISAKKPSEK